MHLSCIISGPTISRRTSDNQQRALQSLKTPKDQYPLLSAYNMRTYPTRRLRCYCRSDVYKHQACLPPFNECDHNLVYLIQKYRRVVQGHNLKTISIQSWNLDASDDTKPVLDTTDWNVLLVLLTT